MFQGEVLALFPAIAGTVSKPWHCLSYAHMGQHGAANARMVVRKSRLATHAEYAPLYAELRRIGYQLEIVQRCTIADYRERCKQLKAEKP